MAIIELETIIPAIGIMSFGVYDIAPERTKTNNVINAPIINETNDINTTFLIS